jgi:hypothetical protein
MRAPSEHALEPARAIAGGANWEGNLNLRGPDRAGIAGDGVFTTVHLNDRMSAAASPEGHSEDEGDYPSPYSDGDAAFLTDAANWHGVLPAC